MRRKTTSLRTIVFLSFSPNMPKKTEQPDIGKSWDRAVNSSRILKTSILVVRPSVGIAILSVEIQSAPWRTSRLRWSTNRRFKLAPISRRQQFNNRRHSGFCHRLQATRRRATNCCGF